MSDKKPELFKNPLIKNVSYPFEEDEIFGNKLKSFATNIEFLIDNEIKKIDTNDLALVISIHSDWGLGKTTFIDKWGTKLTNDGKIALKFDAWKFDHNNELGLTFIAEMCNQLAKYKDNNLITAFKELMLAIIPFGQTVMSIGGTYAECHGIAGASDIANNINKHLDTLCNKLKPTIENFHKQLSNFTKEHGNLYFFIDELDRCKPIFAIQLLEIIKHLFNVKGVCFILALNKSSLACTIEKVYGLKGEMAAEYLERFFDFQLRLPEPDKEKYAEALLSQHLPTHIDSAQYFQNNGIKTLDIKNFTIEVFKKCCTHNMLKFSLRDIEKQAKEIKFFLNVNAADKTNKHIQEIFIPIAIYLLCLRRKLPLEYNKLIQSNSTHISSSALNFDNEDNSIIFSIIGNMLLFTRNPKKLADLFYRTPRQRDINFNNYFHNDIYKLKGAASDKNIPPTFEHLLEKLDFTHEAIFENQDAG